MRGTSLVVQWLRLCAYSTGIAGLVSGWGTKTPYVVWPEREKKNVEKYCLWKWNN